jgi:ribosomal protein L11 methyltransferase
LSHFHRLSFELPEAEQEWLSVELFARGADGISTEESGSGVRLVAYCPDPLPEELSRAGHSWGERGIRLLAAERCESRDWLAAYRAASVPLAVGRSFVVDPREPEEAGDRRGIAADGRILLRVPARRAFGTGSHPSTRMVLEWLESLDLEGRRVLDLGSGTGILSLAASSLGAASTLGIDVDPVACFVAAGIRKLNPPPTRLVAGGLACLGDVVFDLALVNILPGEWLAESAELARVVAESGEAILSGVPIEQADEVSDRLAGAGFEPLERRVEAEWAALRLRRVAR